VRNKSIYQVEAFRFGFQIIKTEKKDSEPYFCYFTSLYTKRDLLSKMESLPFLRENEGGSVFFSEVVSHNRGFLEAESSARRCLEIEQKIRVFDMKNRRPNLWTKGTF